MTEKVKSIVQPKVRGFICTTAHPTGCAAHVQAEINTVLASGPISKGPRRVLVIGASTGYGLSSRIVSAFACGAETMGVFFEKPPSGNKTASAGWYNNFAFEQAAKAKGLFTKSFNGDAFSTAMKETVIEAIQKDWGGEIDLVIYSLASPKRIDPETGESYQSCLKPVGVSFESKTVDVMKGEVSSIEITPASESEIAQTVKVMGGEDWALWIDTLLKAGVLAKGAKTIAYSYIGPAMTHAIYRAGTIGHAKCDLENTAVALNEKLESIAGQAFIAVNKAVVTQASAAIPVVPLYISLLFKIMKEKGKHEGCIEQIYRLFADGLYQENTALRDEAGRFRVDDYEMSFDVQQAVLAAWEKVNTDNLLELSDLSGYRDEFYRLFGFNWEGVDYTQAVEIDPNEEC